MKKGTFADDIPTPREVQPFFEVAIKGEASPLEPFVHDTVTLVRACSNESLIAVIQYSLENARYQYPGPSFHNVD